MNRSKEINKLMEALSKAQGEMKAAKKSRTNTFLKSSYAELKDIIDVIRGPFSKYGLSYVQYLEFQPSSGDAKGYNYVVTTIGHSSGQYISSKTMVWQKDQTPQGFGTATTYTKRYALMALAGVCVADDDLDDDGQTAVFQENNDEATIDKEVAMFHLKETADIPDVRDDILELCKVPSFYELKNKHLKIVSNLITRRKKNASNGSRGTNETRKNSQVQKRSTTHSKSKQGVEQ